MKTLRLFSLLLAGIPLILPVRAANINYSITYDDPTNVYSSYYSEIDSNLLAAGAEWASNLVVGPANSNPATDIEIVVRFNNIPTATGGSLTAAYVGNNGTYNLFEQGMAYEFNTGTDPNGSAYDFELTLGTSYLQNTLWFDPDPTSRTAPIPALRTDAYSVLLHELGHGFAFNGFRDQNTGTLPNNGLDASTFDAQTTFDPLATDDLKFTFTGANAVALYGAPVPLTFGNIYHFGNNPGAGSELNDDLMFGPYFEYQKRYDITNLDRAVLNDIGITTVPEPTSCLYLLIGGGLMLLLVKKTFSTGALERQSGQKSLGNP